MRPIKFRGWDTKRNKMYSPEEMGEDELTINPDGRGFVNVNGSSTRLSQYMNHIILEQFTGQLDKNGKEIYEGDILKQANRPTERTYEVKFYDSQWTPFHGPWGYIPPSFFEVIGNIHDKVGA